MGIYSDLDFVRDEIQTIPNLQKKPNGGLKSFTSRIGYAISLCKKEPEILVFAVLQWVAVSLAYVLFIQIIDWIPEDVWQEASSDEDSGNLIVSLLMLGWGALCVGLAAYPVGVLTGCMGAAHFLNKQGQESTVDTCLKIVMPQSGTLWAFHWIDGWITAKRIFERLPRKDDKRTTAQKLLAETLYYAWKMGVAGVLPSIVTGNNLLQSGKNSVRFVKDNFIEVAKLRAGYSMLCWVVGIGAYIGAILILPAMSEDEVAGEMFRIISITAIPLVIAVAVVMLFLRPIYVIAICDLYSDHLELTGENVELKQGDTTSMKMAVVFLGFCVIFAMLYILRQELGIMDLLATTSN